MSINTNAMNKGIVNINVIVDKYARNAIRNIINAYSIDNMIIKHIYFQMLLER